LVYNLVFGGKINSRKVLNIFNASFMTDLFVPENQQLKT